MENRFNKINKNKQRGASSKKPIFVLTALLFVMIIGLGFFRFSAAQLERRLNVMERSLERLTAEETELKRILSSQTSPIRIYSHCKDRLGMAAGRQEVVRVQGVRAANAAPAETQRGWRAGMFAFFGLNMN